MFTIHEYASYARFSLYRDDLDQLSEDTKSFLDAFAACVNCRGGLNLALERCPCDSTEEDPLDVAMRYSSSSAAIRELRGKYENHDPGNFVGRFRICLSDWIEGQGEALLQRDRRKFHQRKRSILRKQREASAPGSHSLQDISAIYSAQSGCCYFCDENLGPIGQPQAYQVDHLQPLAKGGANGPWNLALTCVSCNRRKRDKPQAAFWGIIQRKRGKEWTRSKQVRNERSKALRAKLAAAFRKQAKHSCL